MDVYKGRTIKLGNDIDTDIIIPTQYMTLEKISDMKKYAFFPIKKDLPGRINQGDIIIAGKNFGCGSSREQAVEIIKELGISCIIAISFARIFYRNSINNGLLLFENEEIYNLVDSEEIIEVNLKKEIIKTESGFVSNTPVIPDNLLDIIKNGGLTEYHRRKNGK